MTKKRLLRRFREYDQTKPAKLIEIAGLLGIPINGRLQVEVPNRNGFVYVRLRNNTNELIQAFNEKVSPVYGLPVLVAFKNNRYEVLERDTSRYSDWGSFSSFLPKHGAQHSLNFENGQGGDVTFVYSRQVMPFATIPSGTEGAGTVFVMPHVYRNPVDASWNYIGDESSPYLLSPKPTGTSALMLLLYWDLNDSDPHILTGTPFDGTLTGTSAILPFVPTITNQRHIPLAAIRIVSGTQSVLWDNIYDMRQWATTTPSAFGGGFAVQDEGVPVGTGTTLNFVGENVRATISGSVVQIFVTGSLGGSAGVDQIGIFGLDDGVPLGTGTKIDFGNNLTASLSGTVLRVDASSVAPVQTDGFLVQDEGILLGTGTILNFVGSGVTATRSGTVFNASIPGGGVSFASYQYSSGTSLANNTDGNVLGIDTELIDANGLASVASNTVTIGVAGWYQVSVNVIVESVSSFNGRIALTLDSVFNMEKKEGYSTAQGITSDVLYMTVLYQFSAGNTIQLLMDNRAGSTITATVNEVTLLKLS